MNDYPFPIPESKEIVKLWGRIPSYPRTLEKLFNLQM